MIDSGPALEAVQVAAATTDARGRRAPPRSALCAVHPSPSFQGATGSLAGAPLCEISADSIVFATWRSRPAVRNGSCPEDAREHVSSSRVPAKETPWQGRAPVITSYTTVAAAARRRSIRGPVSSGSGVLVAFGPQGPHGPRPAPDLVGAYCAVIEAYGNGARVERIGRNQGPDATAGAWADYVTSAAVGLLRGSHLSRPSPGRSRRPSRRRHVHARGDRAHPPLPLGNYHLIARVNASGSFAETNSANSDVAAPSIAPTSTSLNL